MKNRNRMTQTRRLIGKLVSMGIRVEDFAAKHGYKPDTVRQTIRRHYDFGCTPVDGTIGSEILKNFNAVIFDQKTQEAA